jgi:hypothetical protein
MGPYIFKVKLFYIKYHNSKNWTLLLTTDLKLKFVQYQKKLLYLIYLNTFAATKEE